MKKMKCACKHEYQDKKYGKGIRMHTEGGKNQGITYTCTVCGVKK